MFSKEEKDFIQARGSHLETVEEQLQNFRSGFPFLELERSATPGDGIIRLIASDLEQYVKNYEALSPKMQILKFVPASGAATRMFKELFEYLSTGK